MMPVSCIHNVGLSAPTNVLYLPILFYSVIMGPKSCDAKKKSKTASKNQVVCEQNDTPISLDKNGQIQIRIRAKPGAKHNLITDVNAEGVGIQINAPPVDGEANKSLIKYLSEILGLRKSDLSLDKGSKSRIKTVKVSKGISTIDEIEKKLKDASDKK